jgi:hypothetical protein
VAVVKAFAIDGVEMWFWSNDHEPPHFHARRPGEWSVDVYFLSDDDEMLRNLRPVTAHMRRIDRRAIVGGAAAKRSALLREWLAIHGGDQS